jgi:hypothetical protein
MRFAAQSAISFLVISVCAAFVSGQGKKPQPQPDLSGTWRFDQNRSNVRPMISADEEIKITYQDPALKIVRTVLVNGQSEERELTYYTDGRGEVNPAIFWLSTTPDPKAAHPAATKSKTKWSRDKIVTRATLRLTAGGHVTEEEVVDEWQISADGKTLTQTTHLTPRAIGPAGSVFVPANRPDDKRVYSLVSK